MMIWRTLALAMLILVGNAALGTAGDKRQTALDLIGQGNAAFKVGDMVAAERHWTNAIQACRGTGASRLEAQALIRRGELYRLEGHVREAADDLNTALLRARTAGDGYLIAASAGALGSVALASRRTSKAEPLLLESLDHARRLNDASMEAASANDLGNYYVEAGQPIQAAASYTRAVHSAEAAGAPILVATAETNQARLALAGNDPSRAAQLLRSAYSRLMRTEQDYRTGLTLIAVATVALTPEPPRPDLRPVAREALTAAQAIADRLNNAVLASLAFGELGRLSYQSGDLRQAGAQTQQALFRAQQASATDIAWRWEWQQARIDHASGRDDLALGSFRRAVADLQSVRQDIPTAYQDGQSYFRRSFGGLYQQFTDLLLRQAERDPAQASALIREARDVAEGLKATELQDYFRDPCVTSFQARQRGIESVSPDTAIIYPIILPDRLALLLSVNGEERQIVVPISQAALRTLVDRFRKLLERRTTNEYLEPARNLYNLLMRPVDASLAQHGITTLVVVPDGVLRTIPLAALYDGQHFLIEHYALATVPGLKLVDPRPLTQEERRTLAVGMSQGRPGFSPLPSVVTELEGIQRIQHGTTLLNASFLRRRFERELRNVDYTMVHIASHSQVGRDPSNSFVLAYDGRLDLDDLESSIKFSRYRDLGIELLVLSACQTATGDDRAALGMAGLALKAGARSVLATLWLVNDQASGLLAVEFYRQLQNPAMSKAAALRAAQLPMLEDPLLGHPAYWAPFLLIGNWL
ncbi:MAG: CHAT domain-containing protein [Acetobacteraceae bacterium]